MEDLEKRYQLLSVNDIEKHGNYLRVYAEKRSRSLRCIHCSSEKILPHGLSSVSLQDSPFCEYRVFLIIKVKRYKCIACNKTFLEQAPYRFKRNKMTESFAKYVKDEYRHQNLNSVAKKLKVGRPTVLNALTID